MKILTTEQSSKLEFKKTGAVGREASPETVALTKLLRSLMVGERILVERAEWPFKTEPLSCVAKRVGNLKFTSRTLLDDSGWVIARVA